MDTVGAPDTTADHPYPATLPRRRGVRAAIAGIGSAGVLACGTAMVLAAVGVGVSSAATGMAAMSPGAAHGGLGLLLRIGPGLLIASVVLLAVAFALSRRPAAAVPALLLGAVGYAGMYAQPNLALMYVSIAVTYLGWLALALWVRRPRPPARSTGPTSR